jgi:hypothetical protein
MLDKWMYVFKNLALLDERPKALRERVFRRLFRIAEIEQLDEAERFAYRESQKHYWDYMNTIQSAARKVAAQKDAVIREKDAVIRETVRNLSREKFSVEQIARITGMDITRIHEILGIR